MTSIIVVPDKQLATIERQGIFTVHREDAGLRCNCPEKRGTGCGGIDINTIPLQFRTFELLCKQYAQRFIDRQKPRGYEWTGTPVILHGPWPSYNFNTKLGDASSSQWAQAMNTDYRDGEQHSERSLGFVQERDPFGPLLDYILVTEFLIEDKPTDLEIPA